MAFSANHKLVLTAVKIYGYPKCAKALCHLFLQELKKWHP